MKTNNETVECIKIKRKGDGVYDIYWNDKWVSSRGHYENVLSEVRKLIQQIDDGVHNND